LRRVCDIRVRGEEKPAENGEKRRKIGKIFSSPLPEVGEKPMFALTPEKGASAAERTSA